MNIKISSIAAASVLALSVNTANAATYSVFKQYTDLSEFGHSTGVTDLTTGVDWTISGTVYTDTDAAGYNITGGTLRVDGWLTVSYDPGTGPAPLYSTYDIEGTATNAGVLFDSGTICFGYFVGDCSAGEEQLGGIAAKYGRFDGSGTFISGYGSTKGLQLLGGAGGASFTVDQPGDLYFNSPLDTNVYTDATGVITLLGGEVFFSLAAR